jgi:hypothetical protein
MHKHTSYIYGDKGHFLVTWRCPWDFPDHDVDIRALYKSKNLSFDPVVCDRTYKQVSKWFEPVDQLIRRNLHYPISTLFYTIEGNIIPMDRIASRSINTWCLLDDEKSHYLTGLTIEWFDQLISPEESHPKRILGSLKI